MMREWTDPFNSFNSFKALLYRDWMEGIVAGKFLPPIEASIDPVFSCNLDCTWCNSHGILKNRDMNRHRMSRDHLLKLCRFLAQWGVKGVCFAGGGEPFLHESIAEATVLLGELGLDTAFLTNGALIKDRDIDAMVSHSRWIGISVDSSSRDTFAELKGVKPEIFDRVISVLRQLVNMRNRRGSGLEISFKFLIHPGNALEILDAVRLAKDIGVDYIHIRPAAAENVLGDKDFRFQFPIDAINQQLQEAFKEQNERFRVFGIRHKFSDSMNLKRNFTRCLAPPLLINLGADGNVYLCVDHRGKKEYIIGRHDPDPEEILLTWGGRAHREMMENVNLECCPRCTFGAYNEIIEKTIIEDRMCRNFP